MADSSVSAIPSPSSSPSPQLQPPNVQLSYGPMLIGVFINMILYGILVAQTYSYYRTFKKDAAWIKYLVFYLFIVETINTGIDMVVMYEPLILNYGQPLGAFPTMFAAEPVTIVVISTPIQLFFAWRIRLLTKQNIIAIVIAFLSLVSLAGGIWTTILITIVKYFKNKPQLHWSALVWLLSAGIVDVLITVTLVFNLSRRKTGFAATDDAISKIIRLTVQTGMLTALFAVGDIVFFMSLPRTAINFIWDLALTKLYANCLLSTLNARSSLNENSSHRSNHLQLSKGNVARRPLTLIEPISSIHVQSSKFEMDETTSYNRSYGSYGRSSPDGDVEMQGITITKVVETVPDTSPHPPPLH